jgi:hypothetical protein
MGFEKTNPVSIESVLMSYLSAESYGDVFSADELLALGEAAAEEYTEKQFSGPAMDDAEWASL